MLIAIVSVLILTGLAALVRAKTKLRLCPICTGVSMTWGILFLASVLGYFVDPLILGILMGGSVVGAAYQLEKRLPAGRSPLLWKTIFIPTGFAAVYELISLRYVNFGALLGFLLVVTLLFLRPSLPHEKKESEHVTALEEKMKKCC